MISPIDKVEARHFLKQVLFAKSRPPNYHVFAGQTYTKTVFGKIETGIGNSFGGVVILL